MGSFRRRVIKCSRRAVFVWGNDDNRNDGDCLGVKKRRWRGDSGEKW